MRPVIVHDTALSTTPLSGGQNYYAENVRWKFGWPQGLSDLGEEFIDNWMENYPGTAGRVQVRGMGLMINSASTHHRL
jgi:hypothetical protein